MTAEMVTVVYVAEEEKEKEMTLSSSAKVNALEKDKEEAEEVREELSNGANGGTVTQWADANGSFVFIHGNDALNSDPVELDLEKNGNGVEGEDRGLENLDIKGELISESEEGSSIGIRDQDKEPMELCHVEGPVAAIVEEKPGEDPVDSGTVSTNAEEDGLLETAGAEEYGVSCAEEIGLSETSDDKQNGVNLKEDDFSETLGSNQNRVTQEEDSISQTMGDNLNKDRVLENDDSETSNTNQKGMTPKENDVSETDGDNMNGVTPEEEGVSETSGANQNGVNPEVDVASEISGVNQNRVTPEDSVSKTSFANQNGISPEHEGVLETSDANQNGVTPEEDCVSEISCAVTSEKDSVSEISCANQNGVIPEEDCVLEISCANQNAVTSEKDGVSETFCSNLNGVTPEEDSVSETSGANQNGVAPDGVSETSGANQNAVTLEENGFSETSSVNQNGDGVSETSCANQNTVIPEDGVLENNIKIDINAKIYTVPVSNGFNHFAEESEVVVVEDSYSNGEVCNHISTETKNEYDISNEDSTTREKVTEIEITAAVEKEETAVNEKEDTTVEKEVEGNVEIEKEEIEETAVIEKEETAVVEKEETEVEKEVEGNAEAVAVVEKEETVVEKEVKGIAVFEKEVEGIVVVVKEETVVKKKDKGIAIVEKEETVVKKEVEGIAESVADTEGNVEAVADIEENVEAVADIEVNVEAVADIGDLNPEVSVGNPEVSAPERPVENPKASKEVSADLVNAGDAYPEASKELSADFVNVGDACNIQFGSFSKETEVVDEVVLKRPFYWLIRVPRYDDDSLKDKIRLAQSRVDEKTQIRDSVRIEMQAKKVICKEYGNGFEAAKSQERVARDLLKSKRQGIDSIQSVINIDDIDGRIRNMEHMIQHETLPLKEEKQLIREIKQLKQVREQLSSSMGRNDEVQQGSAQKEQVDKRMKSLKKEADQLRDELLKAEAVARAAKKKYYDEIEKYNKILSQFKAADGIRQEAYAELQSLKKQMYEKNKCYWQYRDDAKKANDFSLKFDKEALQNLCVNQVERFMELWNNNDEFRKEYLQCNVKSTLRRLRTLDGRALGPDEQPPVIPQAAVNERGAKSHISNEQMQEKVVFTEAVKERTQEKVVLAKAVKSVPVSATVSIATVPSSDEIEEEKSKKLEEEELARKAEKLRKEEEEVKLREQRRLEEIAKAKKAQERKKRIVEKAQARAAQKAQKEAEQKEKVEKEREKRAMKKERRKLAAVAVESEVNVSDEVQPAPTSKTPALEILKESEIKEKIVTVTKRSQKPSQFVKTKSIPPPLRSRGKRRMQPWMWLLLTALVIFVLFLVGNSHFFKVRMQRFDF